MKMQGISLIMAAGDAVVPVKGTKLSDSTFDSFMSKHASKVSDTSAVENGINVSNSNKVSEKDNRLVVGKNPDPSYQLDTKAGQMTKDTKTDFTVNSLKETMKAVDLTEVMAGAMAVMQEIFGLSEEELVDVMEQLGMQIQDLLFQVQDGRIVPLDASAIQELVLGVHGIDDATAILTNDALSQELSQLTEELTNVLAEGFGVEPEEVADLQQKLMFDFTEQMQRALAGEKPVAENIEMQQDGEMTDRGNAESVPVVVESEMPQDGKQDSKGNEGNPSDFATNEMPQTTDIFSHTTPTESHAPLTFTENLSQALEQVSNAEELSADRTMMQIIEQVVRQVRIRVMPETTSMELQLNPASLGRVSLTVATTAAGVATANMVVENQMAKDALESQMITLKETFAERGLKVEEVEVTVGEFSLKKEDQQQQQEAAGDSKQHRKFRPDDEISGEEDSVEDVQATASERRDVYSTVDYTA